MPGGVGGQRLAPLPTRLTACKERSLRKGGAENIKPRSGEMIVFYKHFNEKIISYAI